MSRRGALRAPIGAIAALLLMVSTGCADDGESEGGASPPDGAGSASVAGGWDEAERRYVLVPDSAWQLEEAIDFRGGLGRISERDPDLDWYAEYDGPRVDHDTGCLPDSWRGERKRTGEP